MTRTQSTHVLFLAVAAALLLAANQIGRPADWSLVAVYGYWTGRVLIEAALFLAFADLIGRLPGLRVRPVFTCAFAALVSLVPFVLSITALDLILGLPELDGTVEMTTTPAPMAGTTHVGSFLRELVYLSDNHLALCLLLSAPRLLPGLSRADEPMQSPDGRDKIDPAPAVETELVSGPATLLQKEQEETGSTGYQRHLERPLAGALVRVEAQEHYVRLVSQSDSQMLLYRFNDIVAELPVELGMQVHRSHWVAYAAVNALFREGGRLFLSLRDGTKVPVSRKFASAVRTWLSEEATNEKRAVS